MDVLIVMATSIAYAYSVIVLGEHFVYTVNTPISPPPPIARLLNHVVEVGQ